MNCFQLLYCFQITSLLNLLIARSLAIEYTGVNRRPERLETVSLGIRKTDIYMRRRDYPGESNLHDRDAS